MNKPKITYSKVYTDDTGKHTQDIFGDHTPEYIGYKSLWNGVVEGFYTCSNSDIVIMGVSGNIRVVVQDGRAFKQYFISGLDGKILQMVKGTTYAIENMDEGKSAYLIGTDTIELDLIFTSKTIFDWKRRKA